MEQEIGCSASKQQVELIQHDYPIYSGRVSITEQASTFGCIEAEVNVEAKSCKCRPCRYNEEMGHNCSHVNALLLSITGVNIGSPVDWTNHCYKLDSYKNSYSGRVPAMTLAGKLSVDMTIAPPEYKRSAGHPPKARKDQSFYAKTDTKRTCKACGDSGHFHTTCTRPSTQYRYENHLDKAIEWCKTIDVNVKIE
jgi:hypothetical protein